ncbi:hypothetical protein UA08_07033 [Talaromyces atroroseus]|uniref:Uncharacterized protein n=1 Tax=Talaromyces atroroseus TaxID=1441469 RepID=A0A225A9I9_TALAT|nr:hypothetical protein UA08_07033 [Talaromyces atroroseus]OKL57541.1 hypothetical protein UA08_07033 [Talaromyces atroroseus]
MSSLTGFLSRIRSIEADEMIDVKALAARHATKQRFTAKSLFTQPTEQPSYRRNKLKIIRDKMYSSQSEIAVADIPVARGTWDESPLAAASQRSTDSKTFVHKTHVYTPTGQDRNNAAALGNTVSPPYPPVPENDLVTMAPLSVSMPELRRTIDEVVFENYRRENGLQMPLASSSTCSTPDIMRPAPSLYSQFSFKSSISDFSTGNSSVNPVEARIFDESSVKSTEKSPPQTITKKSARTTENTKRFTESNTKQQKPRNNKQELWNKPLPAIPMSVSAIKLPREPTLRASNHVANLMSKYTASAPVWADSNESPTDKYFRPHPVANVKTLPQEAFDLEFELDKITAEAKNGQSGRSLQNEEHVVAPLNVVARKHVWNVPAPARGQSGGSSDLPSPKPHLESTKSTMQRQRPLTPKLDPKEANLLVRSRSTDSQVAKALGVASEGDEKSNNTNPSTIPANTFVRAGITPQLRPAVISKCSETPDNVGLYTRSFIVDPPSIPSPIDDKNEVVEDDNETMPHGDKIFIKLSHVESVVLNFHLLHPCS